MPADIPSPYRVYQHDSRHLQERLEEEFDDIEDLVDVIITSPPYADLIDYGDHDEQVGQQAYESFLDDIRSIFRQCYNIATDDATLWVITDTYKVEGRVVRLPFDIADEIENLPQLTHCTDEECGAPLKRNRGTGTMICTECNEIYNPLTDSWRMEDNIIWDKLRTRPWHQKGRMRNVYEHVSMFSKTDDFTYNKDAIRVSDTDEFEQWWVNYPERYSPKGMVPSNVWEFPIPKQGQWGPKVSFHPSPFPEQLVERIVRLATDPGDVVFDPFAGIGTTLAIAEALDRKPLGFELNSEYIEYYEDHVRPTALAEVGTKQDTLHDAQAELQRKIYTLRIHKYAYKLYKELINSGDYSINEGEIEFITVSSDPAEFDNDEDPSATIQFVCEDDSVFEDVVVGDAMEGMLSENKGSGDYYGVSFSPAFVTIDEYQDRASTNGDVFLYMDGAHNWVEKVFTGQEWGETVSERDWGRYWSKSWPPLVSNLEISVSNPMDEERKTSDHYQAGFEQFD
ncbi:DNA-methyltransferase [Halobaculum rubrum]|uniref:DNA-methyltransferase n=1 Tax=Halobaculum rubrum TaxID=2872158 RepID=UPI001CA3B7D0|nr:site-specific DNA-methyltransferase [Halobaculum rubrum]QZY01200.1 site-specific DNA-methyltransferase [Halobaculum rubrum]